MPMGDVTRDITTKVDWGGRMDGAEERYKKCTERYKYLEDPRYMHKKEQLYLMSLQGFSGKFVHAFFCNDANIVSPDLDLMRCLALLCGEEFAMQFYKQEFSLEDVQDRLADYVARKKYSQFEELERLLEEKNHLQERFEMQMEFMKREQQNARTYAENLTVMEREKTNAEKELIKAEFDREKTILENERDNCMEKLQMAQEEISRLYVKLEQIEQAPAEWEVERERLLLKCEALREQTETNMQENLNEAEKENFFNKFFAFGDAVKNRKEKKQRNLFITEVVTNPAFSREQLEIILRSVQEDFSLEELQQLCVPELPAQNMEILERYFIKAGNHRRKEVDLDGGTEKSNSSGESAQGA